MTTHYKFLILLFALILSACSSSKKAREEQVSTPEKPSWVLQRPVSSEYYIGIGMAMKRNSPAEYPNVAKRNAISDLASEIKVSVSGNSVLSQFENNDEFRETFTNNTKVKIQEDLEEFEVVGAWESNDEFWVYYRLSKAKYREIKQRKINSAIASAKSFVVNAEALKAKNLYNEAISNYFKAFLEIEKYLDEDLRTELDGQEVFFAAELLRKIEALLAEIEIRPIYPNVKRVLSAIWGEQLSPDVLSFSVRNKSSEALQGLEFAFTSNRSRLNPSSAISNENGIIGTSMKLNQGLARREVTAQLVLDDFSDKVLRAYIRKLSVPSAIYYIDVRDPTIQVITNENEYGKKKSSSLQSVLSAALSKEGFTPSSGNADYKAMLSSDTQEGGVNGDFYTAYLNGDLSIVRLATGDVVFKYSLSSIKGVGLNYKTASQKAYEAAKEEIERKAVWQFMQQIR